MKINKWNFRLKKYELFEIPNNRNICFSSNNMSQVIQCVNCGKELTVGESNISLQYHTNMGFGYCVCNSCYQDEWGLRRYYDKVEISNSKEAPEKPYYEGDGYADGVMVYDRAYCPRCNTMFEEYENNGWGENYCHNCGQHLDWGVDKDEQ